MRSLPVIGIPGRRDASGPYRTPVQALNQSYFTAVITAGGVPVVIPLGMSPEAIHVAYELIDGLLLSGGVDILPSEYGQDNHPDLGEVDPLRDATELLVARKALADGMPILGICRGIQLLNVAAGGTLIQDIGAQVPGALTHPNMATPELRKTVTHEVTVEEGSRLAHALGATRVGVNSGHHQAVDRVARGFRVVARAPDGIIEGIEAEKGFAVAVQWHPEELVGREPWALRLFEAFTETARR